MTIHPEHPFLAAAEDRDPVRRLRARLVAPVTIWAASAVDAGGRDRPAGLTVGSTTIVDGQPACALGIVDPEAELWSAIQTSGRFTVNVLSWSDRNLADVFAGLAPAPGGAFPDAGWRDTSYGPALDGRTWAGCRLLDSQSSGYDLLVAGAIEEVVVVDLDQPDPSGSADPGKPAGALARFRGRYVAVPPARR